MSLKSVKKNNYAFIDSQNVNLGVRALGWRLDWHKFRRYLKEKYGITKAYLFIGYVGNNASLYTFLQDAGFICVFKPTLELPDGKIKGNVDAELVLHTMIQLKSFEQALIVSGDGDFYCLVEHLLKVQKLNKVLVPDRNKYSTLLNKLTPPSQTIIDSMNDLRSKLQYKNDAKEKGHQRDGTLRQP